MVSPEQVLELIDGRYCGEGEGLIVYWCQVEEGGRDKFAHTVTDLRRNRAIVPLVLRKPLFNDPNAIQSDLNVLIAENREALIECPCGEDSTITILILARNRFVLPQTGSPTVLPEWFPRMGGKEVYVHLHDLLHEVDGEPLNSAQTRMGDLSERLFHLERMLVARLEAAQRTQCGRTQAWWQRVVEARKQQENPEFVNQRLLGYRSHIEAIGDPREYRPTARPAVSSLLGDLLTLVQRCTVENMPSLAAVVASAFDVERMHALRPPMFVVLLRPTNKLAPELAFTHTLVLSLFAGYQLLTGAAHAGEYPRYTAAYVFACSRDLRLALRDAEEALALHTAVP